MEVNWDEVTQQGSHLAEKFPLRGTGHSDGNALVRAVAKAKEVTNGLAKSQGGFKTIEAPQVSTTCTAKWIFGCKVLEEEGKVVSEDDGSRRQGQMVQQETGKNPDQISRPLPLSE